MSTFTKKTMDMVVEGKRERREEREKGRIRGGAEEGGSVPER